MKRSSFVLLICFVAATAAADTSFTLTVPNRVTATELVPISRVRLTLECTGTVAETGPSAGKLEITNNGVTQEFGFLSTFQTFANPDASNPASLGDRVKFTRDATATNRVHIELSVRHVLADPAASFCNLFDPLGPAQTYSMTLKNATVATGTVALPHRLTSYGVGGITAAPPATNCSFNRRRIANTAATVSGIAGTFGRHPLDIVLVLDESGSMDWDTIEMAPATPERRMDVLKGSASQFLTSWIAEPSAPPEDRMGIVRFATNATPSTTTTLIARGTVAGAWSPISTTITSMTPTSATAIGKGLQVALDTLATSADATILLMSDGFQNVDPEVVRDTTTTPAVMKLSGTSLNAFGIPIVTVALGPDAGVDAELLSDISRQTAARQRLTARSPGMDAAFLSGLVGALVGNTLLVATEGGDTLPAGAMTSAPISIPLDGSIRRVLFRLSWSPKLFNALDLEIFSPGTTDPIDATLQGSGSNWIIYSADIPSSGPAGNWNVRIKRKPGNATFAIPMGAIPYHFGAYTYEGKLDFDAMLLPVEYRTGDSVVLHTEVSFGGQAMTSIAPNISLRIARPGESLGNILHDTNVGDTVLEKEISPADTTSPYQRKLQHLAETTDLISQIEPQVTPGTIPMQHVGGGLYKATFTDTTKPGHYQFLLTYDFDAPDGSGRIRRIEQIEREIKLKPDAEAAVVNIVPGTLPGHYFVNITPKDSFGNFLGPGYADHIRVTVTGPGVVGPLVDRAETGDYVAEITGIPDGATPGVTVQVDDVILDIDSGPGSGGGGGGAGQWRAFIDFGTNFPHASGLDGEWSINAGLERMFSSNWSVEGILGYHTFDAAFTDVETWQLSLNAKYFFGTSALRPFVNGGVGLYDFDPGQSEFGANAGVGLLYMLNPKWGIEGVYNYHKTHPLDWSTLQVGVRWQF